MATLAPTPSLWFHDNAEEAMKYYVDLFPNSSVDSVEYYPDESLDEHFAGMSGKVIDGRFTLNGQPFICLDGGPHFTFNEAISFTVRCADQAEIDRYWAALSAVPESEQCGWCKDKFGLSWQIVPDNIEQLVSTPEGIKAMMSMKKFVIADFPSA